MGPAGRAVQRRWESGQLLIGPGGRDAEAGMDEEEGRAFEERKEIQRLDFLATASGQRWLGLEKEWDVREIVQRLACFLKERWKTTQPASMYRSKGKALDLYTNEATHEEFEKHLIAAIRHAL